MGEPQRSKTEVWMGDLVFFLLGICAVSIPYSIMFAVFFSLATLRTSLSRSCRCLSLLVSHPLSARRTRYRSESDAGSRLRRPLLDMDALCSVSWTEWADHSVLDVESVFRIHMGLRMCLLYGQMRLST